MFHLIKFTFYLIIAGMIAGLIWFWPKYKLIKDNPGFCAPLTEHIYYCGDGADLKNFFLDKTRLPSLQ